MFISKEHIKELRTRLWSVESKLINIDATLNGEQNLGHLYRLAGLKKDEGLAKRLSVLERDFKLLLDHLGVSLVDTPAKREVRKNGNIS